VSRPDNFAKLNGNHFPFPLHQKNRHPLFWRMWGTEVGAFALKEMMSPLAGLPPEVIALPRKLDVAHIVDEFPLDPRLLRRGSLRYQVTRDNFFERLRAKQEGWNMHYTPPVGYCADATPQEAWQYNIEWLTRQMVISSVHDFAAHYQIKPFVSPELSAPWQTELFVRAVQTLMRAMGSVSKREQARMNARTFLGYMMFYFDDSDDVQRVHVDRLYVHVEEAAYRAMRIFVADLEL